MVVSEYLHSREKRALDLVVASSIGSMTLAAGMTAALVVKAVNGSPMFFRQERAGVGNKPFDMLKLRTMDDRRRVLRLASYLRSSGLDETPQFLHVFFGHMSVVGHRPLPVDDDNEIRRRMHGHGHSENVDEWLELKEQTKPGIVSPGHTFTHNFQSDSVAHMLGVIHRETSYLRGAGIMTDLHILAHTPLSLIMGHDPIIPRDGLDLSPEV
ncbi:TPA: hypothetical protein DIS56_02175 [Candidatus Saccharibacteria bacterium]|nr:MAG: Undecaprenyl-phosphate glucose phosphotransferase [Candidatus Saccharibacteria bacterium GW2011_GWA2_46_10]HCM51918.1 hypothetical protein [Candidatus Saccharibacteria bacterium]